MASLTSQRMSREEFKKARELEELRKAGVAPPEVDEDGQLINPHIPQYISQSPWYLNDSRPGLKHQKSSMFKGTDLSGPKGTFDQHYQRGRVAGPPPAKFVAGACTNCGATSHKTKDCCERPRKKGAALTGRDIMPAERVQQLEFTYDGKRDRWNGYDTKDYSKIIRRFEVTELERKKKKLQELDEAFELEKQEERRKKEEEERKLNDPAAAAAAETDGKTSEIGAAAAAAAAGTSAEEPTTDARRLRAIKKQEKLKKLIRRAQKNSSANNTGVGEQESDSDSDSDGSDSDDDDMRDHGEGFTKKDSQARMTVRNLRIREDTPKYLRNLDLNSAYYDPKTRSMRDNPYEGLKDARDVLYAGDNFVRKQGDTKEIQQLQSFVWESVERGNEGVHVQALPSQAEKLFAEYKAKKDALANARKNAIHDKYLTKEAAAQHVPRELLVPASEAYVEYDETGVVVKGAEQVAPRTKYAEDVLEHGHRSVWGSYFRLAAGPQATAAYGAGQWGYACCHQTIRNAICTGEAGKQASSQMGAAAKEAELQREKAKASAAAAAATASAAAAPSSAAAAVASAAASSSSAAAPASSSMDTSADQQREKRKRRRDRSSSSSRSRSSSSSSSSSSGSSDSSSSSSSGSDSDSDSGSSRRRRRDRDSRRRKERSRKDAKKPKRERRSASPARDGSASAAAAAASSKNSKGYNSFAADAEPTEKEMDDYHKKKRSADDPMLNMPKDGLLEQ